MAILRYMYSSVTVLSQYSTQSVMVAIGPRWFTHARMRLETTYQKLQHSSLELVSTTSVSSEQHEEECNDTNYHMQKWHMKIETDYGLSTSMV